MSAEQKAAEIQPEPRIPSFLAMLTLISAKPWAFIPKCNIFKEDGSPIDFNMGTMESYESSKDIWREFCKVCGATVFWHCKERPYLLDVSVGLLDPKEGARVESWLDWWTGRVSFSEMAVSTSLINALEEGLKKWGEERSGREESK
jgi:hypothetical protein